MRNVNPPAPVTCAENVGVNPDASSTAKENTFAEVPAAFLAVIVYEALLDTEVGVPEMRPVEVLKLSPVGNDGDIEYVLAASPLLLIEYKPLTALSTFAVPVDLEREISGD